MPRAPQGPPEMQEPTERRTGIVTGWRCWTVLRQECLLRPIWKRGLVWTPRQPYEAFCASTDDDVANTRPSVHTVPHKKCKCGVWAVCHPMLLDEVGWEWEEAEILVVGQVALWGRVIEFQRGWRAQFAYPVHLYALTDDELLAYSLRDRYGVPVAFGPAAWALARVLPPSLLPPGRPADEDSGEMPNIPVTLAGIVEMVRATDAQHLDQVREDIRREQEQLARAREALKLERGRLKVQKQAQLVELERVGLEQARRHHRQRPGPSPTVLAGAVRAELLDHAAPLKREMTERGITQDMIAAAAGVSRSAVSHFLAGRHPSKHIAETIERLLNKQPVLAENLRAAGARARMRELGWTQTELGRRLGVTSQAISQVLGGTVSGRLLWERIEKELARGAKKD